MKGLAPVLILAGAILLAALIFACSSRFYVTHTRGQERVLDRWTGKMR